MTVLYLDCFSGASGDMILGALIDAGVPVDPLRSGLRALGIDGWELTTSSEMRGPIRATKVRVEHGDEKRHRSHSDIVDTISSAGLSAVTTNRSLHAFELLAEAEAKVHGVPIDRIHFHEVGALDAVIDVVGTMLAVELLEIDSVVCSPLVCGRGTVPSTHGTIPVPAPAVVEILARVCAPLEIRGEGELLTPTGAAIVAAISDSFGDLPAMNLVATGYGAGSVDREIPNVLRVLVGQPVASGGPARAWLIETNVDDMVAELVPHVIDALIEAGAHDAWSSPIVMKKGRPALMLGALVGEDERDRVLDVLYRETTTFGARIALVEKDMLERSWVEVEVAGEQIRVKLATRGGDVVTASPEYEDARRVARASGMPLKDVYSRAVEAARRTIPS